jgi:hypothetical protein
MGSKHSIYSDCDKDEQKVSLYKDDDDTKCCMFFSKKVQCSNCLKKVKKAKIIETECCKTKICNDCNFNCKLNICRFCSKNMYNDENCLICFDQCDLIEMECCKKKICKNCSQRNNSHNCWFCRQYINNENANVLFTEDKISDKEEMKLIEFLKERQEKEKNTVIVIHSSKQIIFKHNDDDINAENIIKLVSMITHKNYDIRLIDECLQKIHNINFYVRIIYDNTLHYDGSIMQYYLHCVQKMNVNFLILDMFIKKGLNLFIKNNSGKNVLECNDENHVLKKYLLQKMLKS